MCRKICCDEESKNFYKFFLETKQGHSKRNGDPKHIFSNCLCKSPADDDGDPPLLAPHRSYQTVTPTTHRQGRGRDGHASPPHPQLRKVRCKRSDGRIADAKIRLPHRPLHATGEPRICVVFLSDTILRFGLAATQIVSSLWVFR